MDRYRNVFGTWTRGAGCPRRRSGCRDSRRALKKPGSSDRSRSSKTNSRGAYLPAPSEAARIGAREQNFRRKEDGTIDASRLNIVILGLSLRSSWGNGHATTYRSLIRALAHRGHRIVFLERDVPWYANHCDLPDLREAELHLY